MLLIICEVLDYSRKFFSHLWGFTIFGKSSFLRFMSCLYTNRFYYGGCTIYLHYYSSLFNGRMHSNIHLFIHVIHSLFFSLFFLCMFVKIILVERSISCASISIFAHSIGALISTWYQSSRENKLAILYMVSEYMVDLVLYR